MVEGISNRLQQDIRTYPCPGTIAAAEGAQYTRNLHTLNVVFPDKA